MSKKIEQANWCSKFNVVLFEEIDSTNEEAKRIGNGNFPKEDYVIMAKRQTKGRGRNGRKWISDDGNLFLSILTRNTDLKFASHLPFILALSVGNLVLKYVKNKDDVKYKWPNDVLINGKKIAGILIETKINSDSQNLDWLIAGIGINLISSPDNMPYPTTSLKAESSDKEFIAQKILDEFMNSYLENFELCQEKGFQEIRKLWLMRAYGIGSTITVATANNRISGTFENLNKQGAIELRLASGDLTLISSGEVFFDKPNTVFNSF